MHRLFFKFCISTILIFSSFNTGWCKRIDFLDYYSPLRHPAPDTILENLEKIILEEELDQYQTEAVVTALLEELADIFKLDVTKSHFFGSVKEKGKRVVATI